MRVLVTVLVLCLGLASPMAAAQPWPQLGKAPPEWSVSDWRGGAPVNLQDLAGDVVLVRWWTAPYCPYCAASAPALNYWHDTHRHAGLRVFGFYHHKLDEPMRPSVVAGYARKLAFRFPTAIDREWQTLRRWWLAVPPRKRWTSVTFLIGRDGRVAHIHGGGQYVRGDAAYAALDEAIRRALAAPGPANSPADPAETYKAEQQ